MRDQVLHLSDKQLQLLRQAAGSLPATDIALGRSTQALFICDEAFAKRPSGKQPLHEQTIRQQRKSKQ